MRFITLLLTTASVGAFAPNMAALTRTSTAPSIASTQPLTVSRHGVVERQAMLQPVDLPEKHYIPREKEIPKVLGGLTIGLRKLIVITGASSGLGLNTAVTLTKSGRYFVVMAVRDVEKGKRGEQTHT